MSLLSQVDYEKMLKLADCLETVEPDSFRLDRWVYRYARDPIEKKTWLGFGPTIVVDPGCGFVGCAIGWASHLKLFPGLEFKNDDGNVSYGRATSWKAVDKLFVFKSQNKRQIGRGASGVASHTAAFLFWDCMYETGDSTRPKQVAARLRRFAEIAQRWEARRVERKRRVAKPMLELVPKVA